VQLLACDHRQLLGGERLKIALEGKYFELTKRCYKVTEVPIGKHSLRRGS